MDLKQQIYNDLICDTFELNNSKSKKDIFLENLNYVEKLLLSGLSTKKQIEFYSKDIQEISRSCYEKYSKEFLSEIYEQGIIKSLFHRNIKAIAYYITTTNNPTSTKLYEHLVQNGALKLAKNKKDSSLDYDNFSKLLKGFLESKGYENLVSFELETKTSKIEEKYEDFKKEKIEQENKIQINENTIVTIPLIDNTLKSCSVKFLKNDFVEFENSYIDNNIKEKNVYYIQNKHVDKEYKFEKFKEIVTNNDILEDYSIILHNNSILDTKLHIYRIINKELFLIKSLNAESCLFELDQLIRRARDNFFSKMNHYLNEITQA